MLFEPSWQTVTILPGDHGAHRHRRVDDSAAGRSARPNTIAYPLADLLRTNLLLLGQGLRDQDDADRLRDDPSFRVASDSRRGTACLEQDRVLPSQPTMSRLLDALSGGASQEVVREAVSELALRRLWMTTSAAAASG